jgi:mannose-6-phosphate isomerase-like protein (cupin superfamily)
VRLDIPIWFVTAGRGRMWRRQGNCEEIVELHPGLCLTISLGTAFQFRAAEDEAVAAAAITMPPWPGMDEAVEMQRPWEASMPG